MVVYNENKNSMDFSFVIGSRESQHVLIDYEKYYKFIFSITSGE